MHASNAEAKTISSRAAPQNKVQTKEKKNQDGKQVATTTEGSKEVNLKNLTEGEKSPLTIEKQSHKQGEAASTSANPTGNKVKGNQLLKMHQKGNKKEFISVPKKNSFKTKNQYKPMYKSNYYTFLDNLADPDDEDDLDEIVLENQVDLNRLVQEQEMVDAK